MGKQSRSGSGINIPDHISESIKTIGLKYLNFCGSGYGFDPDRDLGWKTSDPG
jgi:hypothetical protein